MQSREDLQKLNDFSVRVLPVYSNFNAEEIVGFTEKRVNFYQIIRCHILESGNIQTDICLKIFCLNSIVYCTQIYNLNSVPADSCRMRGEIASNRQRFKIKWLYKPVSCGYWKKNNPFNISKTHNS
jgi:hypothetical protein